MALLHCDYFSMALENETSMYVALPVMEKGPYPVIYLLHALNENASAWSRNVEVDRFAREYNVAIVMPEAGKSYYTNMVHGERYLDHIAYELPEICENYFNFSPAKRDNFVVGFSMGGYGALKVALTRPDKFEAAASINGVVEIETSGQNGSPLFKNIFGEGNPLKETEHDLKYLIENLTKKDIEIPRIYQFCGLDDNQQLKCNRSFKNYCETLGDKLRYEYHEKPGYHDYTSRIPATKDIIEWIDRIRRENN